MTAAVLPRESVIAICGRIASRHDVQLAAADQIFRGSTLIVCRSSTTIPGRGASSHWPVGPPIRGWVLGLVTTKQARLESVDDLARRIEAASRSVPLERLAVSPRCGFATSGLGSGLIHDDERARLRLVTEAARKVWG
jgi:hypothetical protein